MKHKIINSVLDSYENDYYSKPIYNVGKYIYNSLMYVYYRIVNII